MCFFILQQACRGNQQDTGTKMMESTATKTDGPMSKSKNVVYRLPAHADFLTAYSTAPSKDKHFDNE